MANLNKVMLIGRLTRDPEAIMNGKGAKFGFAVNNRKQNPDTQQWEDVPVFIDMEIWNRGEMGKNADRFLQNVRKGHQIFIEGHLKLDTWDDKNGGGKRSKLCVVVENFQYLEARPEGLGGGMAASRPAGAPRSASPAAGRGYEDEGPYAGSSSSRGGGGDEDNNIPF